jgi:hypothetical protein
MARLLTPGLQFYIDCFDLTRPEGLPRRNELYVVCQDGSIQVANSPGTPVKWKLIETVDDEWYCLLPLTAVQPVLVAVPCSVRYHSRVTDPPPGRGSPTHAEITDQKDEGSEVTSQLKSISKIDPLLAHCAVILDDPVQTAAMAKFAEGKMSYAEMRGLCG